MGFEAKGELDSKELNRVLKKLEGHPEQRALHQLALRSMMQAVYSSIQAGHYGLAAEDYLHFTSPIRRYPDLLVHRLLKSFWSRRRRLSGQRLEVEADRLEMLAVQCSERERAAMQTEREVSALYACLLMKSRVGEQFTATVGGLSENGFFVVLDEHHVEGFVRGESVHRDFELDPATYRLVFQNGRVVRVGQKATVVLLSVNLQKRQMEFGPVALDGEPLGRGSRGTSEARHGSSGVRDCNGKARGTSGRGRSGADSSLVRQGHSDWQPQRASRRGVVTVRRSGGARLVVARAWGEQRAEPQREGEAAQEVRAPQGEQSGEPESSQRLMRPRDDSRTDQHRGAGRRRGRLEGRLHVVLNPSQSEPALASDAARQGEVDQRDGRALERRVGCAESRGHGAGLHQTHGVSRGGARELAFEGLEDRLGDVGEKQPIEHQRSAGREARLEGLVDLGHSTR